MPKEIYLVKVGMTMTEGMVSEWYIPDGASVRKGEMLYALETEKVNLDVDAETDGTVIHQADVGVMMEPGDVVGYIYAAGEAIPEGGPKVTPKVSSAIQSEQVRVEVSEPVALAGVAKVSVKSSPAARRLARELDVDLSVVKGSGPGGRITSEDVKAAEVGSQGNITPVFVRASPLVKRLAGEKGLDLGLIKGSGPGGRIVEADLANQDALARTEISAPSENKTLPVKGIRKVVASRMHASLQNSAQLTMDMEVVMEECVKLREQLIKEWEAQAIRPTFTDLVLKAVAKALPKHPRMNSVFGEDEITLLGEFHIGIAVALEEGLVVPVIRDVQTLSLKEIAIESARLASRAREGTLGLDDYAGGTFTISSLGMYGVDSFTPILNEPQTGILGVNRIFEGFDWEEDKPVKVRKMNLSLTWDHRVLDGAPAAGFLAEVQALLASPYRLLV
jgi:pyruvate dehydrogenase E2 component (dihydrolipoamide acetyltransferase)